MEDSALMSSFCFETLLFSTQFIQVLICCRGVCRGGGNRSGLGRGRRGDCCASCGGISSAMGKFSILPYFFLRLFRGFWGIRELRRRGREERPAERRLSAPPLPTNAFRSIPPLTLCDSPPDPPPSPVPLLPFTRHKFNGTCRIINKANR